MNKKSFLSFLRKFFSSKEYVPLTQTALFKQLKISTPEKKQNAKEALDTLLRNEEILVVKKKFTVPEPESLILVGTLRTNPKGFGFVIAEESDKYEDTFIPKHLTNSAIDGDIVEVEVLPKSKKDKGPEGKILSIIERSRSHLGGTVLFQEGSSFFIFSPLLGPTKNMKCIAHKGKLKPGSRVIVKVVDWGSQKNPILCEVTKILGHIDDASIDIIAASEEFQIADAFPQKVIDHAKSFGTSVPKSAWKGREDFTGLETMTIDPTTAKDFDDAISITKDKEGRYHLGVHIADVAHYVQPGSPLDEEAVRRSNSTYFPGSCLPMLPKALSNNLCSLKEKVVRLTVSVLMTFSQTGRLVDYKIQRGVIKSAKRFSYEDAKAVLDGKKRSKYKPTLLLMVELCHHLKKLRSARGTIDFSLPEVVLNIDEKGEPTTYHIVDYDITHQMIEEFMLKANEVVAKALNETGLPLIFRTHEEPSSDSREDFFNLARSMGFFVPAKPEPKDVQKLFNEAKGTPYAQRLSVAFIKSMKLASYSPANIGHYGLALEEYCHFTSPIRRYPDLIIQRLLFKEHDLDENLEKIAEGCSLKERTSFKAEQSVKTLKKMRLLQRWQKENPDANYECQITKIKPFGIQFELIPLSVEGFLHVSKLGHDYFLYEPDKGSLLGRSTNTRLSVGDKLPIKIKQIDLVLQEVEWELAIAVEKRPPRKKKKFRKKRK